MTIQEEARDLELEIKQVVTNFTNRTGVLVEEIRINNIPVTTHDDAAKSLFRVLIDIQPIFKMSSIKYRVGRE